MNRGPLDGVPFTKPRGRILKTHKRYRDAGALYARHVNTDLVRFRTFADGAEAWGWAEQNKDPLLGKQGRSLGEAMQAAEGQMVLVYDPDCIACPQDLVGCHYCHKLAYQDVDSCQMCGRGLLMTDRHGWAGTRPVKQYYSNPEDADVDLDFVPFDELAEYGELPHAVAKTLIEWQRQLVHDEEEYHHDVATFLDMLAVNGYGVVKIEAPNLADLLPAPEGS